VLCHFSQDETPEILAELEREGLPLEVEHDSRPIHDQGKIMTRLARAAVRKHGADLVVALDGDEFLVSTGEGNARAALEALPDDRVTLVPWRTYVPTPDDPADEPLVLRRMRHHRRREAHLGKVILPRALVNSPHAELEVGSHHLLDTRRKRKLESQETEALALAHFPVRSEPQLCSKVLGGWPVTYANPHRWPEQNEHWRDLFYECRRNGGFSPERVRSIPLGYAWEKEPDLVLDPVEASFELRHPAVRVDPERVFEETVMGLADEVRRLSASPPPFADRLLATVRRRVRDLVNRR
jgi:hypothetical protein